MSKHFLLSVLFSLWVGMDCAATFAYQADGETEEYAAYSLVLDSEMKGFNPRCTKLVILNDYPAWDGHTRGVHYGLLRYLKEGIQQDFEAKNKQPHKLKNLFDVSCPYLLVSVEECQELAKRKNNKEYKAKCADLSWSVTLSRVGFSHAMDQALVYVGIHSSRGVGYGRGDYYLLSKEDGEWKIQQKVGAFKT